MFGSNETTTRQRARASARVPHPSTAFPLLHDSNRPRPVLPHRNRVITRSKSTPSVNRFWTPKSSISFPPQSQSDVAFAKGATR